MANTVANIQETTKHKRLETCEHPGKSCWFHFTRSNTGDGESAAVVAGSTVASTVSHFMAFSKGSGNDWGHSWRTQEEVISSNYMCTHNWVNGQIFITC
jgi:hypothetical protein